MSTTSQLENYTRHLRERYFKLIEKSNDYKFEDEAKSDIAAFKALKLLEKLNQVRYLNREVTIY